MNAAALAALCACLLASQATAFQISVGKCDENIAVVKDFDAAAYMGHWLELEAYSQIWEFGGKCSTADYSLDGNGTVIVKNTMSILGKEVSQEGTAVLTKPELGEGHLDVTFDVPIFGERKANYLVLDTDYENYSVVYSCSQVAKFFKGEGAWILSRSKTLSEETSAKIEAAIKAGGLKRNNFRKTKQDC